MRSWFKPFLSNRIVYSTILIVSGVVCLLIYAAASHIYSNDKQAAVNHFIEESLQIANEIGSEFSKNQYVLLSFKALFASASSIARDDFSDTATHFLRFEPNVQFLAFLPRVADSERQRYESEAQRTGLKNFSIMSCPASGLPKPQVPKPEYFPVFFIEPKSGNNRLLGIDLSENPAFRSHFQQARDRDAILALIDPELGRSFWEHPVYFLAAPFYGSDSTAFSLENRRSRLQGYFLVGFRFDAILKTPVEQSKINQIFTRFNLVNEDSKKTIYSSFPLIQTGTKPLPKDEWYYSDVIHTGHTTMEIQISAGIHSPFRRISNRAWWLASIFWILTLSLAIIFLFFTRQNVLIRTKVAAQTAEFKMLLDNVEIQIWYLKDPGTYGKVNNAHAQFHHCRPDDLENQPITTVIPRHLHDIALQENHALFHNAQPRTFRVWLENGAQENRLLDMTQIPKLNDRGNVEYVVCTATDVTERYEAERQLHDNQVFLQTIFDSIQDALFIWEYNSGVILDCNPAAAKIFGYSHDDLLMKTMNELFSDREAFEVTQKNCDPARLKHGETIQMEQSMRNQQGAGLTCDHVVHFLQDEKDDTVILLSAVRDITKKKSIEQEIAQSQKLSSIGQLAAGIAHEINTPIQFIGDNLRFLTDGFNDMRQFTATLSGENSGNDGKSMPAEFNAYIRQRLEDIDWDFIRDEIPKAIEQALEGVKRVRTIVMAMKEFAHPEAYDKMSSVDINRIINNTVIVAKNEWKYVAEVSQELAPGVLIVECFPDEIGQVILNLIINAAHAIDSVKDRLPDSKGTIRISTAVSGEHAEIRIADNGSGIPESIRNRIFDPFFTTKEVGKGTGQGLALARASIVQKHQGALKVESEPGKGSVFIIQIPLHAAKPAETPSPS